MKRIRILGAGLSGLTAAINLAKEGYQVDVFEKNEDVGMRFHGDIQGLENWSQKKDVLKELKKMNIEADFDCHPFSKVILTNCSKTKEINSKKPLFYLVKRGRFQGTIDYSLKAQALKSGVNINFQKTLSPKKVNIMATGTNPKEVPGVVKGIIFGTNFRDTAIVVLNDKLAFKGYSYLLIAKGHGCMCTVVLHEMHRVNACFKETKEFFVEKLNFDIESFTESGGIGSFSLKNVREGNTLYVGEAAGLQDLLWGFGMRYAVTSGYLAAQGIMGNSDYEKTATEFFRNKLKASVVNRCLWENVLSIGNYSIPIDFAEFAMKNLQSMHSYNLLQRMIYPLASFSLKRKYPNLKF